MTKPFRHDLFQPAVVLLAPWPDGYTRELEIELARGVVKSPSPNLKSKEVEKTIAEGRKKIRRNNRKHKVKKVA